MFTYRVFDLAYLYGNTDIGFCFSQPSEYGKAAKTKMELQARNAALSMMGTIIQKSVSLMVLAREKAEEVSSAEILSKSSIVNTLLPLILAHISPLATSDSRVRILIYNKTDII